MKEQWQEECAALRAELAALQQQLQVLGAKRASTRTLSRRRLSKGVLVVVLPVVALLAAGGVLYGQGAMDALFIDKDGNVGIGTTGPGEKLHIRGGKIQLDGNQQVKFTDTDSTNNLRLQLWSGHGLGINVGTLFYAAGSRHSWRDSDGATERMALTTGKDGGLTVSGTGESSFAGSVRIGSTAQLKDKKDQLDVTGPLRILTDKNPIRVTSAWSNFPAEGLGHAEISNDTGTYKSLMIVGNRSNNETTRRVTVYDRLEVAGELVVNGLPMYKKIQGSSSAWGKDTIPIDPYCSDADGCRVTIVAEPPAGQSDAFKVIPVNIAVSSGGVGNQSRRIFMVDKWGDVQCQVNKNCGRQWFDEVKLDVDTDKLVFSIRPQWGATVTIYDH